MTSYQDKPWLAQLNAAQREPVQARPSVLHAFRDAVRAVPDRTAIAYFDGRLSYAEVDALTDAVAGHLATRGFRPGDRLALMLQNTPHYVLALLGTWKAGGTVVPVNPMYKAGELRHVLHDAGATALVCSDHAWREYVGQVAAGSPVRLAFTARDRDFQTRDDERVLRPRTPDATDEGAQARDAQNGAAEAGAGARVTEARVGKAGEPEDLLTVARGTARPPADSAVSADGIALISYTSGTSGVPKGATNTHANLAYNADRQWVGHALPDGSTYFGLAPLFHITGMVCQLGTCFAAAGTLALAHRFEPGVVLDAFLEHRPAYTVGPSTAFMALLAQAHAGPDHFASFRIISSGGAPLPPALVERFRERFGRYLHNGYGLTECSAPCASVPPGVEAPVDPVSGTLAVGVPGPDTLVRIIDEAGADVPIGETGEIAVRGPMVVPGYWRRPEDTAAAMPGGELRTGDVGFMDQGGWLYVVDRKKDMINASGFKVWPREVEDVLYTHPAVREAAVVGVPDPYRGETVKAYVSLRPGAHAAPEELSAYCRDRLAAYKYPRVVDVLPELPKTTSGKILRRELRSRE